MATVKTEPITEADLLLEENRRREVVNGEWVTKVSPSLEHAFVIANVYDKLKPFTLEHNLGYVLTDGLHYRLKQDDEGIKKSRLPDASYIRKERITAETNFKHVFPGAPDLAIEVVSPTENEDTLLEKVRDYLAAGTEEVWVLYPAVEEVHRYRRDEPKNILVYSRDDILESASLFPGLQINVVDFFSLPK